MYRFSKQGEEEWKIPKSYSESVNRGRTGSTMTKRKKGQNDEQRSIKHIHKNKDRVTRTLLLKTGDEIMCSGRDSS